MNPIREFQFQRETSRVTKAIEEFARRIAALQNDAIDSACWDALSLGMAVHVYPRPNRWSDFTVTGDTDVACYQPHFIGIALEEGPIGIVWHSEWEDQ